MRELTFAHCASRIAARTPPISHERTGKRRPAGLMRGAKPLAGIAVKVFVQQQGIAPSPVALEAGIRSQRWSPVVRVTQEQFEQSALELIGHLFEARLPA
jgi:hypothetical protein